MLQWLTLFVNPRQPDWVAAMNIEHGFLKLSVNRTVLHSEVRRLLGSSTCLQTLQHEWRCKQPLNGLQRLSVGQKMCEACSVCVFLLQTACSQLTGGAEAMRGSCKLHTQLLHA